MVGCAANRLQMTVLHTGRYQSWRTDSQTCARDRQWSGLRSCAPAVSELRVDPLSGLRTIVAPGRAGRTEEAGDPFAEGNESQTPPECYAVREGGSAPDTPGWSVRVFPNLFPALDSGPM